MHEVQVECMYGHFEAQYISNRICEHQCGIRYDRQRYFERSRYIGHRYLYGSKYINMLK